MKPVQYRIPRYLGLKSAQQRKKQQTQFNFGYSEPLHRELVTDAEGTKFIQACLQPKTETEIKNVTGLSLNKVRQTLKSLNAAGIVKPVPVIKEKFKRYDRHLLFFDLNGADALEAQKRISNSKIALIGMGGIGSWVSLGLIGSGFKEIKLMDFDVVELSNLTRQVLYTEKDIGLSKTKAAAHTLQPRNTQTKVTPVELQVKSAKELKKHLRGMDMVIVSADRPAQIHDWIDKVCIELEIPYLNLGYRDGRGVVGPMTLTGKTSCYQCYKPELPEQKKTANSESNLINQFENRYQAPSFGPLNSIVSSVGVLEVLKFITGMGEVRSLGVELEIDPMTLEIFERPYDRDTQCWHCGSHD